MNNIFLDTNILIDMFLDRDDGTSYNLFKNLILEDDCTIYINDISIINTHYIISKFNNKEDALNSVKVLIKNCELVLASEIIINQAINSDFSDFEDAIQYYCAKKIFAHYIITRNTKDFIHSKISVLTPNEWNKSK